MDDATLDECTTLSNESFATADTCLEPDPVRVSVALLVDAEINRMSCDDLIDIIRLANLPALDAETNRRLEWMGEADLRRMAYLTRRCCQNRMIANSELYRRRRPLEAAL